MIARENELRDALNHAARELRREQGALGEERDYGGIQLAVGDRIICRRNDRSVDVDNGMRGTVRQLDANTVTIDTDGGLVRELPAAYVQEHVEHAYSLTGHGMQGGTVQKAIVVASPRDLSAGWSYTALSRARGETRLLLYEESLERERSEFAPSEQTEKATRTELLARIEQRMTEPDDEDLAIEQLSQPLRERDPEPSEDHTVRPPGERIAQLRAQLNALPTRALRRVDDLTARMRTLTAHREQLEERLAILPAPTRRLGREHDLNAVERAHLYSALQAGERELTRTFTERTRLERNLGADPAKTCTERDDLQRALAKLTREQRAREALTRSEHSHDRTQDPAERNTALDLGL
jgi:hypothetical protein